LISLARAGTATKTANSVTANRIRLISRLPHNSAQKGEFASDGQSRM
jgi:hypothetical protein